MKQMKLLGFLAAASMAASLSASTIASWDFNDFTAGTAPSGSGIAVANTADGNQVTVVSGATNPASPFSGQSLLIRRGASATALPIFQAAIPGYTAAAPLSAGTVSFDLYIPARTEWGWGSIEIDLGTTAGTGGSARPNSAAALQIRTAYDASAGTVSYFSNSSSGSDIISSDSKLLIGQANAMSISWDNAAKTYSVMLNGNTIIDTAFTSASVGGVSSIRFTTVAGTTYGIDYYIDNLNVAPIPESGSTVLVVAGVAIAAACLLRRRRA